MTHSSQVVDLSWTNVGDDGNEVGSIAKITVVKEELDSGFVSVFVDVVNTSSVEGGSTTDDSMDLSCQHKFYRLTVRILLVQE